MANEPDPARPGDLRPGGRSARVRVAVLDAAAAAVAELGYDELSIEDVAARAGVHKTTIYRRWPTKSKLIADAMRERSEEHVPVPDTGTLLGDLTALARAVATNIGSDIGARMTKNLVAAQGTASDLADDTPTFFAERLRLTGVVVERAIERGELPQGIDANLVLETLVGPLYVRLLLTGEPLDHDVADRVAALVARGAERAPPLA